MWMNHSVTVLATLLGFVFVPISLVTMNLGGLLMGCSTPFVMALIPAAIAYGLSFIWPGIRNGSLIVLAIGLVGLLLFPILSLIWLPFFVVIMGLSRLYRVAPWLSVPIGIVGIPFAVIGNEYIGLLPSMGEFEQKWVKESICLSFPYSADFSDYYSFAKQYIGPAEGVTFSFDYIDLDGAFVDGAITADQHSRWSRIRSLNAFHTPGPLRADVT